MDDKKKDKYTKRKRNEKIIHKIEKMILLKIKKIMGYEDEDSYNESSASLNHRQHLNVNNRIPDYKRRLLEKVKELVGFEAISDNGSDSSDSESDRSLIHTFLDSEKSPAHESNIRTMQDYNTKSFKKNTSPKKHSNNTFRKESKSFSTKEQSHLRKQLNTNISTEQLTRGKIKKLLTNNQLRTSDDEVQILDNSSPKPSTSKDGAHSDNNKSIKKNGCSKKNSNDAYSKKRKCFSIEKQSDLSKKLNISDEQPIKKRKGELLTSNQLQISNIQEDSFLKKNTTKNKNIILASDLYEFDSDKLKSNSENKTTVLYTQNEKESNDRKINPVPEHKLNNKSLKLMETSNQNEISVPKSNSILDIENNLECSDFVITHDNFKNSYSCENSFKKKLSSSSPKDKSNIEILTNPVSKIEITKEKNNSTQSKQNIASSKTHMSKNVLNVNVEQKTTNLKIRPPELERSSIPMFTNSCGQQVFRFYWLDAYEDSYKHPGTLFLFGKVFEPTLKQYTSCCVAIKDVPRRIFVLPGMDKTGKRISFSEAHAELKEHMIKKNITKFKCKEVQKKYAFEKEDVPQNTAYIEVKYSALDPALDSNYSGPSIQTIFGTNVTALELFLIENKIYGPCWMDVKILPQNQNISTWCKIETSASMEAVSVIQPKDSVIPPITVATISIQVSLDEKRNCYDIACIGISCQQNFQLDKELPKPLFNHSYCLVQSSMRSEIVNKILGNMKQLTITFYETETKMLEQLLRYLEELDPDFLIGYDTEFEFDLLVRKIVSSGLQDWSKIGKLKRTIRPKFKDKMYFNQILCGRPLCDIKTSLNEFQLRTTNSDLVSLYSVTLNKEVRDYEEIKSETCLQYYSSSLDAMKRLVKSTMSKVSFIFEIMVELNILSLAIQVTKTVGNTLSRTLSCGVSERNEFLLLHEFDNKDYLTPDKRKDKSDVYDGKKKSAFTGGITLEPKAGFYDTLVLLLDFNSLYPSIIQEFNICFSTIPKAARESTCELVEPFLVAPHAEQGILPAVISRLVENRVQIMKMMDSSNLSAEVRRRYNSRQLALKLIANSMYGCLGAPFSRFYAKNLAALVALRGRQIFHKTKDLIQSYDYEVIYGDTDSFMINVRLSDYEKVVAVGKELRKELNKLYKKISIKIDQVFKCLLLMKKKQYAGLTITKLPNGKLEYKKEIKGLEIVRRDCCAVASDTGNKVLDEVLKDQPSEVRLKKIFEVLETINRELREGKIPVSSLEITKTLSKNLNEYRNKNHPHLIVAERLNKSKIRPYKAGDMISYIICEDNTDRKPLERAYHVEELIKHRHIKIDVNYYLLNQIFPIILKICDPIEGIEDVRIAQTLGISDIYKPKRINEDQEGKVPLSLRIKSYDNCVPLQFNCRDCKQEITIKTSVIYTKNGCRPSLAMCSNRKCNTPPYKYPHLLQNKLQLAIRKCVSQYYSGEVECSNTFCSNTKRAINLALSNTVKCYECLDGKRYRKYTEIDLHNQLVFFMNIVTLDESACQGVDLFTSQDIIRVYTNLKEFMLDQIDCNAYSIVDLDKVFSSNAEENKSDNLDSDLI